MFNRFSHDRFLAARLLFALLSAAIVTVFAPADLLAQSSFLIKLDVNRNQYIDLKEITASAKPALERYAAAGGLRLTKPYTLQRWGQAYDAYKISRGTSSSKSKYIEVDEDKMLIQGFGVDDETPFVPGFGLGEVKYPYTPEDIATAESILRRYDENQDGYIDRREAQRPKWTGTSPFDFDDDNDNRVSLMEFAQRFAHRRITAGQAPKQSNRYLPGVSRTATMDQGSVSSSVRTAGGPGSDGMRGSDRGSRYLAFSVFALFDKDRNGKLQQAELRDVGIDLGKVDLDFDGSVDRNELDEWVFREMESRASDLGDAMPGWFLERDANQDGQVDMVEFTDIWDDEKVADFDAFDVNEDGMITSDEAAAAGPTGNGSYSSQTAQVMLPRSTVISEIEIEDDFLIADLNVKLSITHTYDEYLDGYLIGPEGQRVELFTAVGKNDDHFAGTIFDDESANSILRGRPPFAGAYQPEALIKRQPGLSQFNGTTGKGIWQLMIQSLRSDRSGILHGWSLMITAADQEPVADTQDSPINEGGIDSPAEPEGL